MGFHPRIRLWLSAAVLVCALATPRAGPAQGPRRDSLSIAVSPGLVSFTLKPSGVSSGSAPVTVTTTWQIQRGGTTITLYAYFSSPAAALRSGPGNVIPSSRVFGKVGTRPFSPFTAVGPFSAGGSLMIYSERVRGNRQNTRTDTLDLQINTTGLTLSPGTYTGVLTILAQAI